jgi:hypothetical protein
MKRFVLNQRLNHCQQMQLRTLLNNVEYQQEDLFSYTREDTRIIKILIIPDWDLLDQKTQLAVEIMLS